MISFYDVPAGKSLYALTRHTPERRSPREKFVLVVSQCVDPRSHICSRFAGSCVTPLRYISPASANFEAKTFLPQGRKTIKLPPTIFVCTSKKHGSQSLGFSKRRHKMCRLRNSKFPLRLEVCLLLVAGCLVSFLEVSYAWTHPAAQYGTPPATAAARFLQQSTWGPTSDSISRVQTLGYDQFLQEQFSAPISSYPTLPLVPTTPDTDCPASTVCRRDNYTLYPVQARFFTNALYGEDQLRQRVAFALHQIFVVSGVDIGQGYPSRFTPYLQVLDSDAFENFRKLLYDITLNAAMGNYLDMANNTKRNPNENYAREVLQLFTIGLNRLNPDGSPVRDVQGQTFPTYDQAAVNAFARLFTGWTFAPAQNGLVNYIDPMRVANAANHDTGAKTLLRGVTLPAGQTAAKDLDD